jgi:iron complex transport system substrate-binding protein
VHIYKTAGEGFAEEKVCFSFYRKGRPFRLRGWKGERSSTTMKKKAVCSKVTAILLAAGMTMGMTACQGNSSDSTEEQRRSAESIKEDNQAENSASAKEEDPQTENTKKTEYPLTITTYGKDGKEYSTTYEKAPEKVLAVYQGCIETMLELGLEDHLAATAGLDNEVPEAQKSAFSKVKYLDEFTPSKETVTMLEPDMIFSWSSLFGDKTLGDAQEWIDKGTNVYISSNTAVAEKSLENEYTDILNMGKIFDVQDKAEGIVNEMKDTIATVKEETKGETEKPSVLVLESGKDGFTNYGQDSLAGDMVTQLGGTLANPDGSSLGKEDVITANPDVIFVVYMPYSGDDPETVKQEKLNVLLEDETYASLDAVKNQRVVPIMLSEMYASATRTQDGIETIAKGLYPDLKLGE